MPVQHRLAEGPFGGFFGLGPGIRRDRLFFVGPASNKEVPNEWQRLATG